jgi:acetyl-CoA carboxylase beta subunit
LVEERESSSSHREIPQCGQKAYGSNVISGKQTIWKRGLESNLNPCPQCEFHFTVSAKKRLGQLFDAGVHIEEDKAYLSCT